MITVCKQQRSITLYLFLAHVLQFHIVRVDLIGWKMHRSSAGKTSLKVIPKISVM